MSLAGPFPARGWGSCRVRRGTASSASGQLRACFESESASPRVTPRGLVTSASIVIPRVAGKALTNAHNAGFSRVEVSIEARGRTVAQVREAFVRNPTSSPIRSSAKRRSTCAMSAGRQAAMKGHSSAPFFGRSGGGSVQQAAIRFTTTNVALLTVRYPEGVDEVTARKWHREPRASAGYWLC